MSRATFLESHLGYSHSRDIRTTALTIMRGLARTEGVAVRDMLGPKRTKKIAEARHQAIYRIYLTGRFSMPEIGRLFQRDHTTVLNSIRRAKEAKAA